MSFATFGNDLYTGRRSIGFIKRRRVWYAVAVAMSVLSLLALLVLRLNPGIEFRGGSEFKISSAGTTDEVLGANAVHSIAATSEARVSKIGQNGVRVQTEKLTDTQTDQVKTALAKAYKVPETSITSSFVGPSWGADVSRKAIQGLLVFLVLVGLVIAAYFRTWKMAAAGLIALLHDLLITAGVYALTRFEVTPATVIGFLTILGYSLYDTVVVFDKVRENTDQITHSQKRTFEEAANLAVNQTLVRSINTSVVALLPVASILFIGAFLLGAGTLRDISLALFVGIAAGTYSSIFIATPLLVDLRRREPEIVAHTQKILRRRKDAAARTPGTEPTAYTDDPQDDVQAVGVGAGSAPVATSPTTATRGVSAPARPGAGQQRQQPKRNQRGNRPGSRR
jgi:preprotein translocase subunit SecF